MTHSQCRNSNKYCRQYHFIMSDYGCLAINLVIIGDNEVGKTTLLEVFVRGKYVDQYWRPRILPAREEFINHTTLEGVKIKLQL